MVVEVLGNTKGSRCWSRVAQKSSKFVGEAGRGESFERKFEGLAGSIKTRHELRFVVYIATF